MSSSSGEIVSSTTTVTSSSTSTISPRGHVPVVSKVEVASRLMDFNKHVEHIARIENILMVDMGLQKEDASAFIRAGVENAFGKTANFSLFSGEGLIKTPDVNLGVWMNELREDYNEKTYDIKLTKTVLINFEGTKIRIRRPNRRVVPRLAKYNEQETVADNFAWVEERVYDLLNADVFLLPLEVPVRIRWLSRFPIAIKLKEPGQRGGNLIVESNKDDALFVAKDGATLFFFARCDRAKEEIFWQFVSASGKVPFPFTIPTVTPTQDMSVINAMVTRIGGDVLVDPIWKKIIFEKVAQKISQIKRPYYLQDIKLTDLDMGTALPTLSNVSERVKVDKLGTWFTMDMELKGPIRSTIVAHVDLMKFRDPEEAKADKYKGDGINHTDHQEERTRLTYGTLSALYGGYQDIDLEEDNEIPDVAKPTAMKWFETIAESKLFKYISDLGFVKKKMADVSDKDITVLADVQSVRGRLAINCPPPPSDRMWYGFLPGSELHVDVTIMLGDTKIEFDMLADFIDKQTREMFDQVITVPNMDDITIPFSNSGVDPADYRIGKLRELVVHLK